MADTCEREKDDWADLPAQESDMLTRRKKLGSKNGDALAAAVLQRALAQPRLAGEVVRWAYPCDADHRRTTRISLGTGRARRPPGLRPTRKGFRRY